MFLRMMIISLGIASVAYVPQLPSVSVIVLLLSLSLLALLLLRKSLLPVLFILGFCWASIYAMTVINAILPADFETRELSVTGKVIGLPQEKISRGKPILQFDLAVSQPVCYGGHCVSGLKTLKLTSYETAVILPGQTWQLLVKLKRPHGMVNPGGFNYQTWLIQQGVSGVGYVRAHPENQLLDESHWDIHRLRWNISAYMDARIGHLPYLPLLKALLTGDKRDIEKRHWDLFAATGTTHLVVISGLHIGLVSGFVYMLIRFLCVVVLPRCRAECWGALGAIAAALCYALAAGLTLPTQRALIMVTVFMLTIVLRRHIAPGSGFAVALMICLLADPLAVLSSSFWLSFFAVFIIFYCATGRLGNGSGRGTWISIQVWVFIGLLPVLAIILGNTSFLSPFANLILVPLFSFAVVPLNLIAALVATMDADLAGRIWFVLDYSLAAMTAYLQWLVAIGGSGVISIPERPMLVYCLAAIGVFVVLLPKGMPLKWIGAILLLPIFLYRPPQLGEGEFKFAILDVGQGLATVIQTRNYTLVYDTGAQWSDGFDMAQAAVIPYLKQAGRKRIDTLVISHGDNDHAGGLPSLITTLPVTQLYLGEPISEMETHYWSASATSKVSMLQQPCMAGTRWQHDQVTFQFLHPENHSASINADDGALRHKANNQSCVLRISSGDTVVLLTGDIEKTVELALVDNHKALLAATVLVAPHHGSRTSSSWPFVKAVTPDYVIFSSGYKNQFSHPHRNIASRYHSVGSNALTTSSSGAIEFCLCDGKLSKPWQARMAMQRYWL